MGKRSRSVLLFCVAALVCLGAQTAPEPLFREGLRLMQQGYYNEARLYLEQAQAKDPDNPEVYFSLGIVFFKLKNHPLAYENYQKALKYLPPPELKGRIKGALADIYFQLEDFKQASQAYQEALYYLPKSKGLRLRLALCLMRLQNNTAALAETEKLLKDAPLMEEAYQLRSLIQLSQANYSQALQDFEKALEKKQPDWESWIQLNWLYRINQDFERASTVAEKTVKTYAREHPEAYLIAGDTAFESLLHCQRTPKCLPQSARETAIRFYEKYTLAEPEQAQGHFKLGKLYLWERNPNLAQTFFRRAETLFPGQRRYQIARLETELASGNREKILQHSIIAALDPHQLEDLELMVKLEGLSPGNNFYQRMPHAPPPEWTMTQKGQWYFLKGYLAYLQKAGSTTYETDWANAEKTAPESPFNDLIRALRLKKSPQTSWTRDLLFQAIRKQPDWWLPYQLLGEHEYEQQVWQSAAIYLDQAIRMNPLAKNCFLKLYEAQKNLNAREESEKTLAYALQLYPEVSEFQNRYWQRLEQKASF